MKRIHTKIKNTLNSIERGFRSIPKGIHLEGNNLNASGTEPYNIQQRLNENEKKTGEKAQLLVSTDYFIRNILNILSNRHRSLC